MYHIPSSAFCPLPEVFTSPYEDSFMTWEALSISNKGEIAMFLTPAQPVQCGQQSQIVTLAFKCNAVCPVTTC